MSCLMRLFFILIGVQLMAASSIQFIFDLNAVYHSSDEVFWREFFKELFTRPPLYFMISGMVLIFIGVWFAAKKQIVHFSVQKEIPRAKIYLQLQFLNNLSQEGR